MQSSKFGPPGHEFLTYVAAGYDFNDTPKYLKDQQYKAFFKSLGDVLPCKFCRDSYHKFYSYLGIDNYLQAPSCGLLRFYYDLRELINSKLKKQEQEALKKEFETLSQTMSMNDPRFWEIMRDKSHKICYTKPSPPFEEVVDNIMKHRAGCNKIMQTCREPLLNNTNQALPDISLYNMDSNNHSDHDLYFGGKKKSRVKSVKRRKRTRRR